MQHVWPWLYDDAEDRRLFTALQSQLKFITKFSEDGIAALHHLEFELLAAACNDPSAEMEKQLVLPLIRERINAAAEDFYRAQDVNRGADMVRVHAECEKSVASCGVLPCMLAVDAAFVWNMG